MHRHPQHLGEDVDASFTGDSCDGHTELGERFGAAFLAALPDRTGTLEDLVVSGDRVVGRFVHRGTHSGELMGFPATGRPLEMRSIDIWRVEDGMFAEHGDELDLVEVFQQIGALPPLGGAGGRS